MDEFRSHSGISWQGHVGVVNYDQNMSVLFYKRPVSSPQKSLEKGRPVFEDILYVRIMPVGERALNVVERPANESDKMKWPIQYAQFERGDPQQIPDGTPIELLHPETPSIAATLRSVGVHTVEQCAEMSAHAINEIMGGQQWANDAKRYLDVANKGMGAARIQRELEERDREIKLLKQQIDELRHQVKEKPKANLDLAVVQELIAQAMQRPEHMPNKSFDPQTAMINSTHGSLEEASTRKRGKPKLAG